MRTPSQKDYERLVRSYVAQAVGMPSDHVIPGNDNNPAPNDFYATVLLMDIADDGIDAMIQSPGALPDTVDFTIRGSRIMPFSVQFYRVSGEFNPYDAARQLKQYAATPFGVQLLNDLGLVWSKASDIRKIPKVMGDQWEERANVDIYFRMSEYETQTVATIESAEINVQNDADGNTLTADINV